jgi:hypothetical protein
MVRQVNAFSEATPGGPTPLVRTSRPGLTKVYTLGTGPILRQQQLPSLFNGDLFSVSGSALYRNQSALGEVPFSSYPRLASANGQLAVVSGGALSVYNGSTFSQILTFDDGVSPLPPFSGVTVLYDIFVFPVVGSNQFYFSKVGDATSINAANFSAAQTNPTAIVDVQTLAEELYFFKAGGATEIWDYQPNSLNIGNGVTTVTAPFALSQGRTYTRGAASQGAITSADNALFWVGDDQSVYRTGPVPQKVSTPLIDDLLQEAFLTSSESVAFSFNLEGHDWVILNIVGINQTWAYDCQTKEWAQWGSYVTGQEDPALWIPQTSAGVSDFSVYAGSSVDGSVYSIDPKNRTDDGKPVRVVVSGFSYMGGGYARVGSVSLHCVRGVATLAVPAPLIEMRYSDDGARTWSNWTPAQLGGIAGYKFKAVWRGLGRMRQPGRNYEFAITDAVNVTIEGASYNEARI